MYEENFLLNKELLQHTTTATNDQTHYSLLLLLLYFKGAAGVASSRLLMSKKSNRPYIIQTHAGCSGWLLAADLNGATMLNKPTLKMKRYYLDYVSF